VEYKVLNCSLNDAASSKISSPSLRAFTVSQPSVSVIVEATVGLIIPPVTVPVVGISFRRFPTALFPNPTTY